MQSSWEMRYFAFFLDFIFYFFMIYSFYIFFVHDLSQVRTCVPCIKVATPLSVKTTLMLLQHVGAKLTSSFYTDSLSSSQHLKNVSFRSYYLAHCRNHRKFQVFQLAKHKNNNLWTCCAQLNMRMISWALQLHYLKETNKR